MLIRSLKGTFSQKVRNFLLLPTYHLGHFSAVMALLR